MGPTRGAEQQPQQRMPAATVRSAPPAYVVRKRNFATRLFGYDVFISFALGPAPRGSLSYASDLARRLRERDFTVFFSEDEAPPGEQLDSTLLKALHNSRILVVVANRGTLHQPRWVRTEVEAFRRRHPARPVIPISVDGALLDPALTAQAQEWLAFSDKIWLDESADAAEAGIASAAVIERLATAPTQLRSNVRWSWVVRSALATLSVLIVALTFFWKSAKDSADQARAELQGAVAVRASLEVPSILNSDRSGGLERSLQQVLAAHAMAPQTETYGAMLQVLASTPRLMKAVNTGGGIVSVAFSHDGSRLFTGGRDGTLAMWHAPSAQPLGVPIEGHKGWVWSLAPSADGTRLVSGGGDATLRYWDARTGQPIGPAIDSLQGPVNCLAVSADGSRMASGGSGNGNGGSTIQRWNARSALPLGDPMRGHDGSECTLAFNPDGSRIVSGGTSGRLQQWDASSGKPVGASLTGLTSTIQYAAYSRDGLRIKSADSQGAWRQWDVGTGKPAGTAVKGEHEAFKRGFSADGTRQIVATGDGLLQFRDAQDGQSNSQVLEVHRRHAEGYLYDVAFSTDYERAVSGGEDGTLALWNAARGVSFGMSLPLASTRNAVNVATFSNDGARIVAGDDDGGLWLWDTTSRQPLGLPLHSPDDGVVIAAFSPDGSRLVSVGRSGTLRFWDPIRGQPIGAPQQEPLQEDPLVVFSADSSRLLSHGANGTPRLWDTRTGMPVGPALAGQVGSAGGAAFGPGGESVLSVGRDGLLRTWDAKNGQPSGKPVAMEGIAEPGTNIAYSPEGSRIVAAHADGALRLWDTRSRQPIGVPLNTGSTGTAVVTFSPDGARLLTKTGSGVLLVWDAYQGKLVGPLRGARFELGADFAAFSPAGDFLVLGGLDGTLRLWDANSGKQIGAPLEAHEARHAGGVSSVGFSPDGSRIVSTGEDGTVRLWPGPNTWAGLLCEKLTRNMTRQQWSEWISPTIEYRLQCAALPVPETRPRARDDYEYSNGG